MNITAFCMGYYSASFHAFYEYNDRLGGTYTWDGTEWSFHGDN